MQARLTAYLPDRPAQVRMLASGEPLAMGRAPGNALVLEHASVSRSHARIEADGAAWALRDLGSKNGSFVDGRRVERAVLPPVCWLRLGDVHCEFAALDARAAAAGDAAWRARRAAATAHTLRLDGVQKLDDLLDASLRGVLELAQCERGFVLLQDGADLHIRASLDLDPRTLDRQEFRGSVGAVQRALHTRRSVVANDIGSEAWLASRQSVIAAQLSALVCLPLLDGDAVLGAVYTDRSRPGPAIDTLDLELLEAFTERAALWIAARRTSDVLDGLASAGPGWGGIVARHGIAAPDAVR